MNLYLPSISLLALAYLALVAAWLARAWKLLQERLYEPWKVAIEVEDHDVHANFLAAAKSHNLLSWRYVLNPVMWVRHWNWEPPRSQPNRGIRVVAGSAGRYKKRDEFDIH